jgi:peptide/nickel transport system permease protein
VFGPLICATLLLAPAAALMATAIAALMGGVAGFCGGAVEIIAMKATDLTLSLPWLFLLLIARAWMPLSMPPWQTLLITFLLLGSFGWAGAARVICAAAGSLRASDMLLQARACGCPRWRLFAVHLLPALRPILLAQFLILIPVFILSEGNLGVLGLGVSEPMPSWGNLLRELVDLPAVAERPWMLAPLVVFALVTGCSLLGAILDGSPLHILDSIVSIIDRLAVFGVASSSLRALRRGLSAVRHGQPGRHCSVYSQGVERG